MKVRNENKYKLNQEHILDTARDLIVKHGVAQVSLRKIARESGYSPASLYEYFDSKKSILSELAWRATARLGKKLRGIREEDPVERLVEIGMAYISFAEEHTQDFLLAFSQLPSKRSSLDQTVTGGSAYAPVIEAVQSCVEADQIKLTKGQYVEMIAFGFWSLVHGIATLRMTHLKDFEADFEKANPEIIRAFLKGFE